MLSARELILSGLAFEAKIGASSSKMGSFKSARRLTLNSVKESEKRSMLVSHHWEERETRSARNAMSQPSSNSFAVLSFSTHSSVPSASCEGDAVLGAEMPKDTKTI
nr:hypothetical protein Iba_chr02fCG1520 [Ipomoea batatas]